MLRVHPLLRLTTRLLVLVTAAAFVYGCPGSTRLASVIAAPGSAFGSVPIGFAKFVTLKMLKISARSSTFGPFLTPTCLAIMRSACLKPGPWI